MYAQRKPIENVWIVRERDRQRFRELLAVLSLGIPIGAFLLLFTWQNIEIIRLGREASRLQAIRDRLQDENRKLVVQIEEKSSLERVEEAAAELGFRTVDRDSLVFVEGRIGAEPAALDREGPR